MKLTRPCLAVLSIVAAAAPVLGPAPVRADGARPPAVSRIQEAEAVCEVAQDQRNEVANRLAKVRADISAETHQLELSGAGVRRAIERLQEQQEQLQLDEAGAQGRRLGLERAIKEYSETASDRAAGDEAVKQYQKLADLRQRELQRLYQLQKAAAISSSDVAAAEAAVAQALADVANAKQRAAGDAGPNSALDAWNREAMNLSIQQLERRARLEYIQSRLESYKRVMPQLLQVDQLTDELRKAEERYNNARAFLDDLRFASEAHRSANTDQTQPAPPAGK